MHQTGMVAALVKHLRHHRFLAHMAFGDVFDPDPRLGSQHNRPLAHPIAQRFGELRVVEDAHVVRIEELRHPIGVAHRRQRPGDHHPVVTRQHTGDPVVIAV
jgi:hypothetical protein